MRRACRATGIRTNRTPGRGVLCSHFPNVHNEIDCLPADSDFGPKATLKIMLEVTVVLITKPQRGAYING